MKKYFVQLRRHNAPATSFCADSDAAYTSIESLPLISKRPALMPDRATSVFPPPVSSLSGKKQYGAVLIVSMLILLVMTIIGLAGMQVTSLEEKMTGNMRDRNLAFQAAESALRAGEAAAAAYAAQHTADAATYPTPVTCPAPNINPTPKPAWLFNPLDANCDGTTDIDANNNPIQVWNNIAWTNNNSFLYAGSLADLSVNPRYIVEVLPVACASAASPCPAADQWTPYRITARATGGSTNAVVILQSVYKP